MSLAVVRLLAATAGILFFVVASGTLGLACWRTYQEWRRDRVRKRMKSAVFAEMGADRSDWDRFVSERSQLERRILRNLVRRYLRDITGADRRPFLELARALEMGLRAKRQLASDDPVVRQRALTTLALVDQNVSMGEVLGAVRDCPLAREPAARLFYERSEDFLFPKRWGTRILLWQGNRVMSAYGAETLYRLNRNGGDAILRIGDQAADRLRTDLKVQVLGVLSRCQVTASVDRLDWVLELLDHPQPEIRGAALGVFAELGWRKAVRSEVPLSQLTRDRNPRVRRAAYRVLGQWGDPTAVRLLHQALREEDHPFARLVLCRAILLQDTEHAARHDGRDDPVWKWVTAERAAMGDEWIGLRDATDDVAKEMIG